jgi:hypothetical protein
MKLSGRNPRTRATNTVFALTSVSLLVAAVLSDGFRATNVDLDDGAVWIVNDEAGWVTKANTQTAETELAIALPGADVMQDGDLAYALTGQSLRRLDGVSGTSSEATELAPEMSAGLGGGTGFLLAPDSGDLWIAPASSLLTWAPDTEPFASVGTGSVAVASSTGDVVVVDPVADTFSRFDLDELGAPRALDSGSMGGDIPEDEPWSMTTVGSSPVVLVGSTMYWGTSKAIDLTQLGSDLVLQAAGPDRDSVLVASSTELASVASDGTQTLLFEVEQAGDAARPVVVGGCSAGAWSSRSFVFACPARSPRSQTVPLVADGEALRFRQDGGALVLSGSGQHHFVVRDGVLVPIVGWELVDPADQDNPNPNQETQTVDGEERECEDAEAPPVARPGEIEFGARPSQTLTLDVLAYFDDPNCDPLAVTQVDYSGPVGSGAVIVNYGQLIQFTAPTDDGTYPIDFVIDDGSAAGEVSGTAVVTVSATSKNAPRHLKNGEARTTVEVNKTVSFNVLVDWVDDDGDTVVLQAAGVSDGGGRVISSPDGLVTYEAIDARIGEVVIDYSVSDGSMGATGKLIVEVQPPGTELPPVARDDYAAGRVGQPIKVFPLANDTDANNDLLRAAPLLEELSSDARAALDISAESADSSFVITASAPGTYIIRYSVSDGGDEPATAAIRLLVIADDGTNAPPVAVRDAAVVQPGRSINVDVLVNDTDPDGDLLAVTSATIDPALVASGNVRVFVIERHYVRVEVLQNPGAPFEVRYGVSDGSHQPVIGVLTVSVPQSTVNQFPLVADDRATVRVGAVVSVDVLANDRDPDGDQLYFIPGTDGVTAVWKADATDEGTVWLDGTTVRFKAGANATSGAPILVYYSVDDDPLLGGLHRTTGRLFIDVRDDATNLPPQPLSLELRVFAGTTARVPVPLTGIDPNGDTVTLIGVKDQDPACGFARVNGDLIVFSATKLLGQCQVTYVVEDRTGLPDSLKGIGVVRIVVVDGDPSPPVALADRVVARPSRELSVDVLANDSDPNGDRLTVVAAEPVETPTGAPALTAAPSSDGLVVNISVGAVVSEATYVVRYTVADPFGGESDAVIEVVVTPDAPPQAPVARDDYWSADPTRYFEQRTEDSNGRTVKVAYFNVVSNDSDPDGSRAALAVRPLPGQNVDDGSSLAGIPDVEAGWIRIVMRDEPQWVVYEAVDADGQRGFAVMGVPTALNRAPVCPAEPVATVVAGDPATYFTVNELVTDPNEEDIVQMTGDIALASGDGEVVTTKGDFETFGYEPNPTTRLSEAVVKVGVEDRRGDPTSLQATCFIRIAIDRLNDPPVVADASVEVEETDAQVSLDLVAEGFVSDPDGDSLTFRLPDDQASAEALGVTMRITDDGVVEFVGDRAEVGVEPVFRYEVWDGKDTSDWQEGKVRVSVVATSRPAPTVLSPTLRVTNTNSVEYDLATGSTNPFDTALVFTVVPVPREGRGSIELIGSMATFTAPTDFYGEVVFDFDATDEVGRSVPGTISFDVIGKPLAPNKPTVEGQGSHSAIVTWTMDPEAPQGAEITEYDVFWRYTGTSALLGPKRVSLATSTTVDDLDFGREIYFSVVARNEVGDSPASPESDPVLLDSVPNTPSAPTVDPDVNDGSLTVNWVAPAVDGTPIIGYTLSILPAPPSGVSSMPLGNVLTHTWTGLTNGVPYQFSVVAKNSRGPSSPSEWSSPPISPAKAPDAPTGVTAVDAGSSIECRVTVSWTAAVPNGRDVDGHRVRIMSGTTEVAVIETYTNDPAISQTFTVPNCGQFTYQVQAHNAEGWSAWSSSSNNLQLAKKPSTPSLLSATSDWDKQIPIRIGWTDESASTGCALIRFEYSTDGQSTFRSVPGGLLPSGSTYTLTAQSNGAAFVNGTQYWIHIRSVNCKYPSEWSSPALPATPTGTPLSSGISITGSVSGTMISWSWNATSAWNGLPLTYSVSGAGVSSSSASGSQSVDYGYSSTQTLTVRACDSQARCASKSLTRTTAAPPPVRVNAYDNYGQSNVIGRAMCRGNPNNYLSMPGGVATQYFTVPSGVASIDTVLVQIDPAPEVTATLTVLVNGVARVTTATAAAGDTWFNLGAISVSPGNSVALRIAFTATWGKIITVYTVGNPGGRFTAQNSCPDGAPNVDVTSTGLRAVVYGWSG